VLGLLVDGDRPRLLPEFKRRLEVHVRGVERFGLPEHAEHRRFDSILSMINHVDGCIAFASSVEIEYAGKLADRWAQALRFRGYPVRWASSEPTCRQPARPGRRTGASCSFEARDPAAPWVSLTC
jgi:hypothetical protein